MGTAFEDYGERPEHDDYSVISELSMELLEQAQEIQKMGYRIKDAVVVVVMTNDIDEIPFYVMRGSYMANLGALKVISSKMEGYYQKGGEA